MAKGGRLYALIKNQKSEIAAHASDCVVKTRLIRGSLNRYADDNPELKNKFLSVETLYLASYTR